MPYSDLVSLLKWVSPELEAKALESYQKSLEKDIPLDPQGVYQWWKLQRGLFDASFLAKQELESEAPEGSINLENHIEKALEKALLAYQRLETERHGAWRREP